MNEDKYLLSSVSNALRILDLLSVEELLGVAEISKRLKLGKASAFRLLYTLEYKGFVIKNHSAKYMLGRKFCYFGEVVSNRQSDFSLAKPELINLRDQLNETVHLSILLPDLNLTFLDKVSSSHSLQMNSRIGYQMPAYCSGSGKVLLADLLETDRENELKNIELQKKTETTITDYSTLLKELYKIKETGYGIDKEESEVGLTCIAVPILTYNGKAVAAISVSGAAQRIEQNELSYVSALKDTSNKISKLLGC